MSYIENIITESVTESLNLIDTTFWLVRWTIDFNNSRDMAGDSVLGS